MPLSWNEIKARALEFSREWAEETSEDAEAKPFWDGFFNIFGINRRRVASFEAPVKKLGNQQGYIDLFWKGVLLVEHKSRGRDLDKAYTQALDYFPGITERDLPKYVLVSDFARFRLYDLEENSQHEFPLAELHKNIHRFGFVAGYQTHKIQEQDPVNLKAAERMGKLHDQMMEAGYSGHPLELNLVRLLFCLFAEDTGIFQRRQFQDYIEQRTGEDGSDLALHLGMLFQILNTEEQHRLKNLDEHLAAFPYINGRLFAEALPLAGYDSAMRQSLLDCCALDWSRISPAIFGSLFQSIMDKQARRNLGAHYTSEQNILKLIKPLFLDDLWSEFNRVKNSKNKLFEFHNKLRRLTFFDPACGCGNFLVIAYRELRLLELEILRASQGGKQLSLDVHSLINLDVDQFYGIEIEEFPAQIAQVALWLMDHQMNLLVSEEFGQYFFRIPLKSSASIHCANALRMDWEDVLAPERCSYLIGNPPFVGAKFMDDAQREDTRAVFAGINNAGLLDLVAAWYVKAARYMRPSRPACGESELRTSILPHPACGESELRTSILPRPACGESELRTSILPHPACGESELRTSILPRPACGESEQRTSILPHPACRESEQRTSILPLPACGERAGVRGKQNPELKEKLKAYARELRTLASDAEQRIWHLLRNRNFFGFKFRRQHPLAGYILDFYCAEAKLAIELDGGQHSEQAAYDTRRETVLQQHGVSTLRFWNNDVLSNTEGVLTQIAEALPLTPTLSPETGRGSLYETPCQGLMPLIPTLSPETGRGSLYETPCQGLMPLIPTLSPETGRGGITAISHFSAATCGTQTGKESPIRAAFVSTNSITQGEQVGALWGWLLAQGIRIHFAHRTFRWSNEAKGKAAVHCVIVGFGYGDVAEKTIFEYENIKGEAHAVKVANINPYLVDAPNVVLPRRSKPLCDVPEIGIGNKPIDGGHYLFTPEEKAAFLKLEPAAKPYFRRWLGSVEFINGIERWCLWLGDCPPEKLRSMPEAMKRVQAVKAERLASKSAPTRKLAETPTRFHVENMPDKPYLVLPEVSSERRRFVPIGYEQPKTLASNLVKIVSNATLYHFGILTSTMHNAWMRSVCGRLESRYRYSAAIVYNNFPWPTPTDKQQAAIETAAQAVLDARAGHPGATLADLYDPLSMPPDLVKAHKKLDTAVDAAYGYKGQKIDAARVAFLFERYHRLTSSS